MSWFGAFDVTKTLIAVFLCGLYVIGGAGMSIGMFALFFPLIGLKALFMSLSTYMLFMANNGVVCDRVFKLFHIDVEKAFER